MICFLGRYKTTDGYGVLPIIPESDSDYYISIVVSGFCNYVIKSILYKNIIIKLYIIKNK